MKKKHTLILLFMLIFAGAALSGHTPAWADWTRECTNGDEPGECVEFDYSENKAYVMRAYIDENTEVFLSGANKNWPVPGVHEGNDILIWRYKFGRHQNTDGLKGRYLPPAPSYIGLKLRGPYLYADPGGSLLPMTQLFKDCDKTLQSPFYVVKLNVRKDDIVEIGTPLGTGIDQCGYGIAIIGDECTDGLSETPTGLWPLAVPQLAGAGPFQKETSFLCQDSGVRVKVTLDECGESGPSIECIDESGQDRQLVATPSSDTEATAIPFEGEEIEFQLERVGIGQVIVCTDDLPIVLWGDQAWWCEDVTP